MLLCSRGKLFSSFLHFDQIDTGMDFFNSYAETAGGVPYSKYGTLYPPLANVLFYTLQFLMPKSVSNHWANTHNGIVGMRGTGWDLRVRQEAMFPFILFCVISAVILCFLIERIETGHVKYPQAFSFACLLSYGTQFAFERGNIIIISLVLSVIFVQYHNSNNKIIAELSLIALAIAAGLKIYPAMFGIVLLCECQWKKAFRTVVYGVICFILPFFIFEGVDAILIFFNVLFKYTEEGLSYFGVNAFLRYAFKVYSLMFGSEFEYKQIVSLVLRIIIICCLVYPILKDKRENRFWLSLVLLTVLFQSSVGYTLCYFIIPFLLFINHDDIISRTNITEFIFYMIIFVPFIIPKSIGYTPLRNVFILAAIMFMVIYMPVSCYLYNHSKCQKV